MPLGTDHTLSGATKVTGAERREHEDSLFAKRIVEIPSNMQIRIQYNADSTALYRGYAPRSLAADTTGWLLHKFTYDSMKLTLRQTAYSSWDLRADVGTTYA